MEKKEVSNNKVTIFNHEKFGDLRTLKINGEPWFVGKDVAKALGYTNPQKAIRDHIDEMDKKMGERNVTPCVTDNVGRKQYPTLINESGMYALILGSKLDKAKEFKHWVTSEVLPTIRKTGGYINNADLMIETYLSSMSDEAKMHFRAFMQEIAKQQSEELNSVKSERDNLKNELAHKTEIVDGFVNKVPRKTKRDILNRVVRWGGADYSKRWRALYKEYNYTFHYDLEKLCRNYRKSPDGKKSMSVLGYAEEFGHIDNLYAVAVKLFETDISEIIQYTNGVRK